MEIKPEEKEKAILYLMKKISEGPCKYFFKKLNKK